MIKKSVQNALNKQLGREFYSAFLYLSMSAYCESIDLPGFAHWMRLQYDEEVAHAMKFYEFINDRGGRVVLEPIEQPPVEFQSPLDVFEKTLEYEQEVSAKIRDLYGLAVKQNDYEAQVFLQWFITEQIEEEKTANDIIQTLKRTGDDGHALLMVDRELAARQPAPETTA